MSTQFDIVASSASTAAVVATASASCGANATAAAAATAAGTAWSPEHLHHHHQPHIAVHTPVHAPRGTSCESQPSFPAYSSGSPQAGFHVPANAYSAITSPSCASATTFARQARYNDGDANGDMVKSEPSENSASARLLDALGATAPTSISHLNAIDCLPFYESKQQVIQQLKPSLHNAEESAPSTSDANWLTDTVETRNGGEEKFHSILDYDNIDTNVASDAVREQHQSIENNEPKPANNNNNNNFVVDNNSIAANNNNNNDANVNGSSQFYSLGKSGNRTFFRAPGLEAPDLAAMASACDSRIRVCPVCSFSCKSTFHYNSHMNTHGTHQCTMCNYTSRTEGRLRKHMRESHTHDDRVKAGLEDDTSAPATADSVAKTSGTAALASPGATATTFASLVNMVNMSTASAPSFSAASSVVPLPASTSGTASNAAHDLLALSEMKSGFTDPFGLSNELLATKGALDQIKALTERANNPLSALSEILGMASNSHNDNEMHHEDSDGIGLRDPTDDDDEMIMIQEAESSQMAGPSFGQSSNSSAVGTSQAPPRRSGRPKIYRCKQCPHVSTTKEQSWSHNKTHIPLDKQLTCQQCGFVTEYKHHLEYHMRNHKGSKPFKCTKCAYTCVNKSMLNSHMKSHTPVYQYRCKDCTYQTKYCHSLKMHLEKYRHTRMPGTVEIDSDGEEKPISEGDPDDYGQMEATDGRGGDESRHAESTVTGADDVQQQQSSRQPQQPLQQQSLNSMLLQPIAPTAANLQQYSDQIQQYSSLRQLEQMNELLRAANSTTTFACRQCDYVTTSNEDLLRHSVAHLFANQQQQQTPSLTSLYQNLAAAQSEQHQQQQQFLSQQQQQALSNALGSSGSELLNGILQPDSGTKELAAQLQQELLRAQAVAQHQQQQQEEESRRQAVVAAMASLANGNLGNGTLTSALLGHVTSVTSSAASGGVPAGAPTDTHSALFATSDHLVDTVTGGPSTVDPSSAAAAVTSGHFHSSNTTTASSFGFGNDDDELQLTHSLSPIGSSGRRGSVGSASTSGGECTSKTCSVSPGSEGHGGSRKRKPSKTLKVEQISAKLRDGADAPKRHRSRERDSADRSKSNGIVPKSNLSDCGGLRARSNTNGSGSGDDSNFSTLFTQLDQPNRMPHACQHCMIAFRDRALYQIHLGYHGYETPFKCNRCGHISDSPLEFNLHLYQARHD